MTILENLVRLAVRYAELLFWATFFATTVVCIISLLYAQIEQRLQPVFGSAYVSTYSSRLGQVLMAAGIFGATVILIILAEQIQTVGVFFVIAFDVGVWIFLASEHHRTITPPAST